MTKKEEQELKRQRKLQAELERLEGMLVYEREYRPLGVVCGIDEVGRGPLAGPVVACAVILPKDNQILYLNDSKKLSASKREELYNCETHNAYNASGFCNETILSDDFPELPEGKTQITWTGGITAVEVIPRWWTL